MKPTTAKARRLGLLMAGIVLSFPTAGAPSNARHSYAEIPLPQGLSFSVKALEDGAVHARVEVSSMRWVGARKGFLRFGALRILRLDSCRLVIGSVLPWQKLAGWAENPAGRKTERGWELGALKIDRYLDGESVWSLSATEIHPLTPGRWQAEDVHWEVEGKAYSVGEATIHWEKEGLRIVGHSVDQSVGQLLK